LSLTRTQSFFKLKHEAFVCVGNGELTFSDPKVLEGAGNLGGLELEQYKAVVQSRIRYGAAKKHCFRPKA